MAYEEISNIEVVALGGFNKKTNKANPTELEGYLVGKEQRPNKFNPGKPQNFYIFQTQYGVQGVYAKAGIDSALKNAKLGVMTKLWATGEELDTGKGFPMKVFKAAQDKTKAIDTSDFSFGSTESDDEGDSYDSTTAPKAAAPAQLASPAVTAQAASRQAEIQAMLKSRRS